MFLKDFFILTYFMQPPFNQLAAVPPFVNELSASLTKVQQQIAENKFGKEARNKIEYVGTLKGQVTEFLNTSQWDQALGKLEECRTNIAELNKVRE